MRRNRKRKLRGLAIFVVSVITALFVVFLLLEIFTFFSKIVSFKNPSSQIIAPSIKVNSVLEFEKKLKEKNIQFEKIEISSQSGRILGFFPDNLQVIFSQDKDIDYQVSSLQLIIQRFTIDNNLLSGGNKKPKIVDLRFDKPIVRF